MFFWRKWEEEGPSGINFRRTGLGDRKLVRELKFLRWEARSLRERFLELTFENNSSPLSERGRIAVSGHSIT